MAQNYKPCLFQKLSGTTTVRDSMGWGIYIKSIPFKVFPDMKDIPSRDWFDEQGDDEFILQKPVYKAYELDCEFVYVGANGTANAKIKAFLNYLAEGGKFKIYDTYREIAVLQLIKEGLLSKEISEQLFIRVHTVNTHRQRILEKLDVSNSMEAVRYASELGLIG